MRYHSLLEEFMDIHYDHPAPAHDIPPEFIVSRLKKPAGRVSAVLDTDPFNEVDDQFALAYILRSPERIDLQAIYAAPFHNEKVASAAEGMERSYQETHRILALMGREGDCGQMVYRGSDRFLADEETPVDSPAARDLVARAMARPDGDPLYVIAIGAITNVASALLMEPAIARKVVVLWLGGHALEWFNTKEFNMLQDVAAARVLLGCGVPVVLFPCNGVVSALTTTGPEIEYWLRGKNQLCDYLCDITREEAERNHQGPFWSRTIWDVAPVAWLLEMDCTETRLEPAPIPSYDGYYSICPCNHPILYVYSVRRDRIIGDLYTKLAR
ncbi:nucleoside hydrolase [bacterium 210820-DFI.6.52]|nr:nucleoside hydrolase [bacterium 210820-DFI.6.52]